jgi:integrase
MRGITADELMDCWEAAGHRYDPEALSRLWAAVPDGMRQARLSACTVPERCQAALTGADGSRVVLNLEPLPEPMRQELTWCVFRIVELGGNVPMPSAAMLVRRLAEVVADLGTRTPCSLMDLSARAWCQQIPLAVHRRRGRLPGASSTRHMREILLRFLRLLALAYDQRPWWQRESWNPVEDNRIPLRPHEPLGRQAVHFHRIASLWLRRGVQWHCKVALQTGALRWSTVNQRAFAMTVFDGFLTGRGIDDPRLAADPARVRPVMLDFLAQVRGSRASRGPTEGQPVSAAHAKVVVSAVEQFYLFMHDHKDEAALELSEPAWLGLGPQHTAFYRPRELPRPTRRDPDRDVIDDTSLSSVMAGIGILGDPVGEGGFGDEQAMRIMMLQVCLGRRISEILMLDRDPLFALNTPPAASGEGSAAFTARLRYQQTKIDGAPDTVLVDAEIVAVIQAQQEWVDRHFAEHGAAGHVPTYLFLAEKMNRNGDRPYLSATLHKALTELARRLDIRDSAGRLVDFQRTHRFRHTKATSLLNAGVPIHVVQRYLGHLSPAMTMHYAQTLAETHEAEFLRYRKLTADAREVGIAPRDLYDMLQLDQRTDRILPNGWCLLPPRQSCDRGNACLTCDKFATDKTFLPELTLQRDRTLQLIDDRRQAFCARTGTPMSQDNVWLQGRLREAAALEAITTALHTDPGATTDTQDGAGQRPHAVRGAGTSARTSPAARTEGTGRT